ncbi:glutamine amidotransferase/cyclase [Capsaspora owczarzaki ATCC 30864]|uniref:Imidazole glycerol phosphate synthase hisHF n=1 Tax=Capsaspora owczarzaki (strain ATCC 30864) TaxID=595528 RepID=A0A0D2WQV3_CAPO3|nr:glutamine amidotransferase/cyclase [Capsaspora owczarzaki ATCC 30864]KJE94115.1 glutamine amidotransferase/cyclase [Capsaspora owczarzaki ATCC 30864]|eukprot:XP_004347554.1 glutamine amidotransferase/cyclase [Capsaspora owczarzaki ATCC 30864]
MDKRVWLLDYGAGNVRSLVNAIEKLGFTVVPVRSADELKHADRLVFPGVGAFGSAMANLERGGFTQALKDYLTAGRPFFGICLGMQTLFASSDESPGIEGLGIIPAPVRLFPIAADKHSVPHMGWNGVTVHKPSPLFPENGGQTPYYYFVHSYVVLPEEATRDWIATTTDYGGCRFVSSVQRGNVFATQFHPEKSGAEGLALIERFLNAPLVAPQEAASPTVADVLARTPLTQLAPRIIACLDVRTNDDGDLVVTKGDQYDVRDKAGGGHVRNLGKPVEVARRYYDAGADEIVFLNITSFRNSPMKDVPMLEVLRLASQSVFVPLTIGGGIRDTTDPDGTVYSALHVANEYFRSGADKVSIGSDAVTAAEEFLANGSVKTGKTAIEQIAHVYGRQAVVVSIDPKRAYVASQADVRHHTFETATPGPNGERFCWYPCTVKGGRETRDIGAYELAKACEALGAGEILLNCIDRDGTNSGYDTELIRDIKQAVCIPVVASSGAGRAEHFFQVLQQTGCDAALAAGIFHREEVLLPVVKQYLQTQGVVVRP